MMLPLRETRLRFEIQLLVEQILETGQIDRNQYFQLASAILAADQPITDQERSQINRTLDYIQTGRIRLVG